MFWNKKEVAEVVGLPVVLSRRASIWGHPFKKFLAYREGNEWRGLVGYEEYKEKTDLLEKKLNLILNHLNLKYVPEIEKKETAKLVEKKPVSLGVDWGKMITEYTAYNYIAGAGKCSDKEQEPKKKKAGRPKKKK